MARYPAPLKPGDRIGITAPSSGVAPHLMPRLRRAWRPSGSGYDVVVGRCLDGDARQRDEEERAAELMGMLTDPGIRAVFPPWGGETADRPARRPRLGRARRRRADLGDRLQRHHHLAAAADAPARLGDRARRDLMDEPYRQPDGLARWSALASRDRSRGPARRRRSAAPRFEDWVGDPGLAMFRLDGTGKWSTLRPARSTSPAGWSAAASRRSPTSPARRTATSRGGREQAGRARSSTSRPARTTRSRSAATCTASGWPAGSTAPGRWSSAAPRRPTPTTSPSARRSPTRLGMLGIPVCSTSGSVMSRRGCRWSTAPWPAGRRRDRTRSPRTAAS